MDHDPVFKDTYAKTRRYPYNATTLDFLYEKTALFLLQYFQNIFHNRGKSIPILNKKTTENAKKINLQKKVPPKILLTKPPPKKPPPKKPYQSLRQSFQKKATINIPTSYSERRSSSTIPTNGENKLTKEDLDDDENDIEEGVDEVSEEIEKALDTSSKLAAEIYNIEY
ncbi:hypothetical protein C2G38_2219736 [Gigaspora rosea]|uniref:Uncharacterized protein n=1 Tax=Gigaspora rosea TaxID=44941 RepID=A0A397UE43_9GLOM|nr:hypothetical protein C2G38_2219736 [Gigaspora rosea]